ncbi:hypothetical protein PRK78_000297 [Emydomyces testavorans]|uniref:Uncharacterized protein n=1 Tax=Emydomyces testavorans TaxID=2070801 RepID=A0AAF0DAF4_9EURO|nr:hypothetical protein PRK78_000297 [Emydomyces testavorans]
MEYFDFDQAARNNEVASGCLKGQSVDALFSNEGDPTSTADIIDTNATGAKALHASSSLDGLWPMYRASEPFTHAKPQDEYLETLHVVGENSCVPTGSLTGKKVLKSHRGPSTGALLEEPEQREKKSGARFSKKAVKVLKSWLSEHATHPYPTEEEKDELKAKTGLKRSQISNWFANGRRRGKIRTSTRSPSPSPAGVPIPGKRLPLGVDFSDLNPLERWKHSPPENEAASARDIIQAMATTPLHPHNSNDTSTSLERSNSRRAGSSNGGSSLSNVRPANSASTFSLDATLSSTSDMSFASAFSHRSSRASFASMDARDRRRRRHKSAAAQNPFQKSRAARIYQCTFCTDSFSTKYDWQRHEKSLHLALDKWTCAPRGGIMLEHSQPVCAFCRHPNPDEDHLESHNYASCQEKSTQERTFYRKDHLNQHLRLMHNVRLGPWMDQWKSVTTEVKSRCGFCSTAFRTWKDRVDHLAAHFKAGVEMSQWKGDWGFEPCVQRCVENAMPPYLIGEEWNTMDPWVAQPQSPAMMEQANAPNLGRSLVNIPEPTDASCFRRLEIELSAFIGRMAAEGVVPTDGMIQTEARRIIYGSDDPWNQTCADNPNWLAILKRDTGIYDLPEAQNIRLDDLGMQPPFAADGGLRRPPMHTFKTAPPLSGSPRAQAPAMPGSGSHSAVASHQGSLAPSLAGSVDFFIGGLSQGHLSGLPGTTATSNFSSSAPVDDDPLIQMGFDADLLQRLDDDYRDIGHDFDGMHVGNFGSDHSGRFQEPGFTAATFNLATASAPTQIPTPGPAVAETGYQNVFDPSASFSGVGNLGAQDFGC